MLTKQDLNAIGNLIDTKLEDKLESKLSPIKKDIRGIKKSLNEVIDHFDRREIKIVNNIRDIQENLHVPLMDFA